jgi:hypothetical protein
MAVTIAGYHQGAEAKALAPLDHLGDTVEIDQLVIQYQICRVYPAFYQFFGHL